MIVKEVCYYYDLFVWGLWDELVGLVEGLDWFFEDVIYEYSGY